MINNILILIAITLMYSSPMIFAAIGGVISERSGITNLGIEGMMTIGAFAGASAGYFTNNPWLGFLIAGFAGAALAVLHGFTSITLAADQTVSGIAINLIGPAIALFLCRSLFNNSTTTIPVTKKLPNIITICGANLDITVALALFVTLAIQFFMYRTKWGLRVRALGEHPAAVDALGVNVSKTRYVCVILSGFLAGIGGGAMTLGIVSQFTPTSIVGQGFIALAAVIFGKWRPIRVYFSCILFGFAQALVVIFASENIPISSNILAMLPYVLTLLILILFSGKITSPKACGKPYLKGSR